MKCLLDLTLQREPSKCLAKATKAEFQFRLVKITLRQIGDHKVPVDHCLDIIWILGERGELKRCLKQPVLSWSSLHGSHPRWVPGERH